jgi:hypothetical protein
MILAACFITDLGTVLALGGLFANFNVWLLAFVAVTVFVLWFIPRWTQSIITQLGATRVSEPEVKFIFFVLFFLGGLATIAKSEAVLPAYLVGLVVGEFFCVIKPLCIGCAASPSRCSRHSTLSSRTLCVATGALVRPLDHCCVLAFENAHKNCRRLSLGEAALHAAP